MKKAAISPSRWFGAWRARPASALVNPADDPADYGTCFGLDLSVPNEPAPARAAQPASGWRARWPLRRRSA